MPQSFNNYHVYMYHSPRQGLCLYFCRLLSVHDLSRHLHYSWTATKYNNNSQMTFTQYKDNKKKNIALSKFPLCVQKGQRPKTKSSSSYHNIGQCQKTGFQFSRARIADADYKPSFYLFNCLAKALDLSLPRSDDSTVGRRSMQGLKGSSDSVLYVFVCDFLSL